MRRFTKILSLILAVVLLFAASFMMFVPGYAVTPSCKAEDYFLSEETLDDGSVKKVYDMPSKYYMIRKSYDSSGNLTDTSYDYWNDCSFDVFSSDDSYCVAEIYPWYFDFSSSYTSEIGLVDIKSIADCGAFIGRLDFYITGAYALLYDIAIRCEVSFYDVNAERISSVDCSEIYLIDWSQPRDDVASYTFDVPSGAVYMGVKLVTSRGLYGSIANYEAIHLTAIVPGTVIDDPADDPEVISGDGIYYQAYDLFSQYIYGVEASELTSDQTMTLTVLATLAALFLASLPFILVIGFIKLFR